MAGASKSAGELVATLRAIVRETEHGLDQPEAHFLTLCRIAGLARRALGDVDANEPPARAADTIPDELEDGV